jgi:hypothetical protein
MIIALILGFGDFERVAVTVVIEMQREAIVVGNAQMIELIPQRTIEIQRIVLVAPSWEARRLALLRRPA